MLVNNKEILKKARRNGYAIPAINTQGGNYDIIRAICFAAEEMKSPIILAHYISTGEYSGDDWFVNVAKWNGKKVAVPVSVHLDHGDSYETCMRMLELGFTSIMIDGSKKPIEDNAAMTNRVIEACRQYDVPVEAEIGELMRLDEKGRPDDNKNIADPAQVRRFLEMCVPDSLAVGIGNAHGYYRGEPDIHLEILEEIIDFTDIPLVLHGCTGMSRTTIKKAISLGVSKINFGTEVRYKYIEYFQEAINTIDHKGHSWKISEYASDRLKEDIKEIIKLSGSANKA